jgi:hypothetical protein
MLRYQMSVLDACEALNGHFSGTSDRLSEADLASTTSFLRMRLRDWNETEGKELRKGYDAAVKNLIEQALLLTIKQD